MKSVTISILFIIFSISTMTAQNLSDHRWKNRILIVAFDQADQENYIQQIRDLSHHQKGLAERKLMVYRICDEKYTVGLSDDSEWQQADGQLLQKIKKKMDFNFSVTLIGLDGGIKNQQTTVFEVEKLFGIIDAMPMRASEIRRSEKDNNFK